MLIEKNRLQVFGACPFILFNSPIAKSQLLTLKVRGNIHPNGHIATTLSPAKWTITNFWQSSAKRPYQNVFILIASEVAGLRRLRWSQIIKNRTGNSIIALVSNYKDYIIDQFFNRSKMYK